MAAKKPNFLDNIWAKGKDLIVKGVTIAGNAGGALLGVPTLGTMAGNILEKIPVKKMAEKAVISGVVDSTKVAETLVKNGVPATSENISTAQKAVKAQADQLAADPTNGLPNQAPKEDKKSIPFAQRAKDFLKQYWYVPVILVVGAVALVIMKPKKKGRR